MHHRERDFSADRIQSAILDGVNRDGKPDLTEAQRLLNAAFLNLPSEKFNKIATDLEVRNSDYQWQKEEDERSGRTRHGNIASGLGDVSVHRDRHGNVVAMVINDSKGWHAMGADIVGTRVFDAGNPKLLDTGRVAQHRTEYASVLPQENVVNQSVSNRIEVRPLPAPAQRIMAPEMMMPPDQYSRGLRQDIVDCSTYTIRKDDNWLVIAQKLHPELHRYRDLLDEAHRLKAINGGTINLRVGQKIATRDAYDIDREVRARMAHAYGWNRNRQY